MENVSYYNQSELVNQVREIGLEIIARRYSAMADLGENGGGALFTKFWVTLNRCFSDYTLFTESCLSQLSRWHLTGEKNFDVLRLILGAFAELRARVFNTEEDWQNFVEQLAMSYTMSNDTASLLPRNYIDGLSTFENVTKTIHANPWCIVLWIMATNEIRTMRGVGQTVPKQGR